MQLTGVTIRNFYYNIKTVILTFADLKNTGFLKRNCWVAIWVADTFSLAKLVVILRIRMISLQSQPSDQLPDFPIDRRFSSPNEGRSPDNRLVLLTVKRLFGSR